MIYILILLEIGIICIACNREKNAPDKLLLFGIDAASWSLLDPLMDQGFLPTFKQITDQGIKANLHTLTPTVSVMLWTTIATGNLPEKHGISSWLEGGEDASGQLAITSSKRKCRALWNIDPSVSVLCVNWWATWPAEEINGAMISNHAHFIGNEQVIFPDISRRKLIKDRFIGKTQFEDELTKANPYKNALKLTDYIFTQLQKDRFYLDLTSEFLMEQDFKLVMVFVRGIDILGHDYLHDVIPNLNLGNLPEDKKGIIAAYCRMLDKRLESYLEILGANTACIIVSDHGMEPVVELPPLVEGLKLDHLMADFDISSKNADGSPDLRNSILRDNKRYPPGLIRGISLNEKMQLTEAQIEAKVENSVRILEEIQVDGQKLFEKIETSINSDELIKLTIKPFPSNRSKIGIHGEQVEFMKYISMIIHPRAGQHWNAPDGVFMASGPGVIKNQNIGAIKIQDVAPTICAWLRMPAAKDLDGKPDVRIFDPSFTKSYPIRVVETYAPFEPVKSHGMEKGIEEELKNELQALGYIQK